MIKFLRKISIPLCLAFGLGMVITIILCTLYHRDVTMVTNQSLEEYLKPAFSYNMMVDLDKLAKDDSTYSMQEKVEIIRTQQLMLLNREAELVNDFRQEMNNNINKMNTWVAFAIGVMSLAGIIFPIIVQVNLVKENENRISKLVFNVINRKRKLIKDGNDKIKEIDESFRKSKSQFEKDQHLQHLLVNFLSFKHGCEDNILQNQSDRDLLMRHVWCKAEDSFEKVVDDCLKDKEHKEESRAILLICLIMMHSMVEKLKCSIPSRRIRELDAISDQIKGITSEIELGQRNETAWTSLETRIRKMSQEIQTLPSLFN